MQPEITVLIPARNGAAFIADAIQSVIDQTFQRWTLTIIDDASTDQTAAIVRRYASDTRITLEENPVRLGLANNWNKCLATVRTKYFMVLCQDDLLYSQQAFEKAFGILEADAGIPAIYCDLMFVDAGSRPFVHRSFHRNGLVDSNKLARKSILQTRNAFGVALLLRSCAGMTYDPELELTVDVDFSVANAKGRPVYHIPEPLIAFRYHGKNQTSVLLGTVVREMTYIARKYGIPLRQRDQITMRVAALATNLARQAVLFYGARGR
jgi:glycosyltransferase involved in cell wall biosynthesis